MGEKQSGKAKTERKALSAAPVFSFVPLRVEQATDLGKGYFLVKVEKNGSDHGVAELAGASDLPPIPSAHVEKLLQRISALSAPGEAGAAAVTPAHSDLPSNNKNFMNRFKQLELERRESLAREGVLIDSDELARRLRISRQSISKAVQAQRMFSLGGASGKQYYPAFYASDIDRKLTEAVSRALGDLPGPGKWEFFTTPKLSLNGKTALDALRKGELARVLVAAASFLES